jgi:hypothetical protein
MNKVTDGGDCHCDPDEQEAHNDDDAFQSVRI